MTTRSAARRSPARWSMPATRHRSRMRSAGSSGTAGRATCRRAGLGPEDAIEAIRAAGGLPVLAHFREGPTRPEVVRELVEWGLGGLEVYYRSFDTGTVAAMERGRGRERAARHGRQRLPWRPWLVCRVARPAVGAAGGRRAAARRPRSESPRSSALPWRAPCMTLARPRARCRCSTRGARAPAGPRDAARPGRCSSTEYRPEARCCRASTSGRWAAR